MQIENTKLAGCVVITPKTVADERGYFMESYRRSWMDSLQDFSGNFVQDNQSLSHYVVAAAAVFRSLMLRDVPSTE